MCDLFRGYSDCWEKNVWRENCNIDPCVTKSTKCRRCTSQLCFCSSPVLAADGRPNGPKIGCDDCSCVVPSCSAVDIIDVGALPPRGWPFNFLEAALLLCHVECMPLASACDADALMTATVSGCNAEEGSTKSYTGAVVSDRP